MNVKKGQLIISRPKRRLSDADMRRAAAAFDAVRQLEREIEPTVWMPPEGSWKERYEALLKHHERTTKVMKQQMEMLITVKGRR